MKFSTYSQVESLIRKTELNRLKKICVPFFSKSKEVAEIGREECAVMIRHLENMKGMKLGTTDVDLSARLTEEIEDIKIFLVKQV